MIDIKSARRVPLDEYADRRVAWPPRDAPEEAGHVRVSVLRPVFEGLLQQYRTVYWPEGTFTPEAGERMGVLMGSKIPIDGGWAVEIALFEEVPARCSSQTHAVVGAEEVDAAVARGRARAPGSGVVGWYHTHPGMGLFLSDADIRTHRVLFGRPWQVAWVFDPGCWTGAFFARAGDGSLAGDEARWRELDMEVVAGIPASSTELEAEIAQVPEPPLVTRGSRRWGLVALGGLLGWLASSWLRSRPRGEPGRGAPEE